MKRLYCAILHAIWAYKNPQTLQKANFKMLSDLLVEILKVQNEDRHRMLHIAYVHPTEGQKQIASLWIGAGIDSSPIKRIEELLDEIEKLKKELGNSVRNTNSRVMYDDMAINTERIKKYTELHKLYNLEKGTVRDIFCNGAEWGFGVACR